MRRSPCRTATSPRGPTHQAPCTTSQSVRSNRHSQIAAVWPRRWTRARSCPARWARTAHRRRSGYLPSRSAAELAPDPGEVRSRVGVDLPRSRCGGRRGERRVAQQNKLDGRVPQRRREHLSSTSNHKTYAKCGRRRVPIEWQAKRPGSKPSVATLRPRPDTSGRAERYHAFASVFRVQPLQ